MQSAKSMSAVRHSSVSLRQRRIFPGSSAASFRSSTRVYHRGLRHRYSGSAASFSASEKA